MIRHLGTGRDSAQTLGALSEKLGLPRRTIEEAVQTARLAGVPVCSGSEGLWLAQTAAEARQWAARQRSRAITLMESAQGVERGAEAMDAPLTLPWDDPHLEEKLGLVA